MKKIVFVENYKKSIKYFFLIATLIFFVFCKKTEKPSTTYGFKGGDFSLHSYKGMFSLDQVRGKVVLIYFGFISCPDICPTTLATVARALKELDFIFPLANSPTYRNCKRVTKSCFPLWGSFYERRNYFRNRIYDGSYYKSVCCRYLWKICRLYSLRGNVI